MALQSQLFSGDSKLEDAAVSDPAHIVQGARGDHVRKIQQALLQLDQANLVLDGIYGPATAAAVAAFKKKRNILNTQGKIDNIVGKKTTKALDDEMHKLELATEQATPVPLLGFAVRLPPVPEASRFRIRAVLLDRPGPALGFRFRIYQIVDIENRLTAFYFKGSRDSLKTLKIAFQGLKALDRGAFTVFTTTSPVEVTGFQDFCTETLTKAHVGFGREQINLALPLFQNGLSIDMQGLNDPNDATFKIVSSGALQLIEKDPRQILS